MAKTAAAAPVCRAVRRKAAPAHAVVPGWQAREVQARLGEDDLRGAGADPIDPGQVGPAEAP